MTDKPPLLASLLIKLGTQQELRDAVLGDLEEEYAFRVRQAGKKPATHWYWRNVLNSLPHLLTAALRDAKIIPVFSATIAAYLLILVVDIYIARSAAAAYFSAVTPETYQVPRLIYFALKLSGVVAAGALISCLTFDPATSFQRNVTSRLAPLGLILILPATWLLLFQSSDYSPAYRLLWLAGIPPSLLLGGYLANYFSKSR